MKRIIHHLKASLLPFLFTPRLSAAGEMETDLFRRRNTNFDHCQQCRRPSVAHKSGVLRNGDAGGLTGPFSLSFRGLKVQMAERDRRCGVFLNSLLWYNHVVRAHVLLESKQAYGYANISISYNKLQ